MVALWPTASVAAPLPLARVKPEPEIVACVIFTAPAPVFVMLRVCIALVPMATLPKVSVVALAASTPAPGVGVVEDALV
jgi:hypothetical protein